MKNQLTKSKSYFYRHIQSVFAILILILLFLLVFVFSKQWISGEPKGCGPTKFINVKGQNEHIDLFYVKNVVVNLKDCPLGVECFEVYTDKNKYTLRLTELNHFIKEFHKCPDKRLFMRPEAENNFSRIISFLLVFFTFTVLVVKRVKR